MSYGKQNFSLVVRELKIINGSIIWSGNPLNPKVNYYHGWHSSKEYQRFKGTVLAVYGYQVIIADAVYHGERNPIDYNELGAFEMHGKYK